VSPNPFTPNNDGINDALELSYDVTAITRAAEVTIRIFDLSGRRVRELYRSDDLSGHYDASLQPALRWDGTDDDGNLVPPGIYVLWVEVEGDARSGQRVRTIAVAY
jgi:flagellar hook assembly protein FlgD